MIMNIFYINFIIKIKYININNIIFYCKNFDIGEALLTIVANFSKIF